ncbi:MAG: hypothetical protein KDD56_06665 [Bdellovibrionales bacterium]|nr:hypothetical protein [Bdellovibrionales bacterium]
MPREITSNQQKSLRQSFQERFNSFLKYLGGTENKNVKGLKEEILDNYKVWAAHFSLMNDQFSEVWELFGKIEKEVPGWYRAAPNEGQWGYLGLSKDGYSFSASIEKNKRRNAAYAQKWLWVTFAWGATTQRGMGDERAFGRSAPIDCNLVGLNNCKAMDLEEQLKNTKHYRKHVEGLKITVGMHDSKLGQKVAKIELDSLSNYSLKEICQRLFIALNNDKLHEFSNLLPSAPKEESKRLIAGAA